MKREQHLKVALKAFSIRLRAGLRIKGLKDTTHGSSGETFLCSLPSSNLTNPIIFGNPEVLVDTYTLDKKIFYHEDKLSTWFPKVISGTSSYYQMAPTIDNPFAKWLREYSKVPNTELPAFGEDAERLFVGGKVDVKMGNIIIEIAKKKFISADKYLSEVTATLVNTSSKPLSDSINHLSQIDPGYSKYVNNIQLDVTLEGQNCVFVLIKITTSKHKFVTNCKILLSVQPLLRQCHVFYKACYVSFYNIKQLHKCNNNIIPKGVNLPK